MHYIVQEHVFRDRHYGMLVDALQRLQLSYTVVRCFPFTDKIVAVADLPENGEVAIDALPAYHPGREDVFCFGAVKMARVSAQMGWTPGSMLNENHDFLVYREHYKDNLLNVDSEIRALSDDLGWKTGELKFIRPTKDTKAFTGQVFTEEEWTQKIPLYLDNYRSPNFHEQTEIQVSSPKTIQKEIRFWVVGGRIVTGSQYRLGSRSIYSSEFEKAAQKFAQRMVGIFQLAEAFVIDVCLAEGRWKIVECGCFNCAGFYEADLQRMLIALEDHFGAQSTLRSI